MVLYSSYKYYDLLIGHNNLDNCATVANAAQITGSPSPHRSERLISVMIHIHQKVQYLSFSRVERVGGAFEGDRAPDSLCSSDSDWLSAIALLRTERLRLCVGMQ